MKDKTIKPYGAWGSQISANLIVSNSIGLGEIQLDGDSIYWLEMRPEEDGRYAVVELTAKGQCIDRLPESMNARNCVHEYGGGAYLAAKDCVYFSQFSDQQLYAVDRNNNLKQLTRQMDARFADYVLDVRRKRLICVMESHLQDREPDNCLAMVDLQQQHQTPRVLQAGDDFYSNPRLSADGNQLAWVSWCHPNMPWDNSTLWLADINASGELGKPRRIAGGDDESVCQPKWSDAGVLYFVADKTGWWNLYRYKHGTIEIVIDMAAEFAVPQWSFKESTYDIVDENTIVCTYTKNGISHLARIDISAKTLTELDTEFSDMQAIQADLRQVVFLAASASQFPQIVRWHWQDEAPSVLRLANDCQIAPDCISCGRAIEFPTSDNQTAHAFFYPPTNPCFAAPKDELPPLLVFSHGGPTGMSGNGLKLVIQYFTSRGFAVLDVNYRGSSGFGRAYRQALNGQWGIADVADCSNAALYLAEQRLVDGQRLAIRGGSAGGYTTLAALTFGEVFKAGCSRYGVSDLETLTQETHKFESRYLDNLIGPYPEQQALYRQRSPIHYSQRLSCPVIFFQGMEDKIVLPNQAERMVRALKQQGLPVAYIAFEGEQHGFRQAQNIKRALEAELYFFSRVFAFTPADEISSVKIDNLERFNG